jgi:hypothetical protein
MIAFEAARQKDSALGRGTTKVAALACGSSFLLQNTIGPFAQRF